MAAMAAIQGVNNTLGIVAGALAGALGASDAPLALILGRCLRGCAIAAGIGQKP